MIGAGLSKQQIARRLSLSLRTVDSHLYSVYGKTGVSTQVALVNWLAARTRATTPGQHPDSEPKR
jgi:DNA-binding CsgD family transcriptional regulator